MDVGGTFTDIVALSEDGELLHAKVLTVPQDPVIGILKALEAVEAQPSKLTVFINATTLGTNLLFGQIGLERPSAILITNRGFEDVLEIGRQNRPSLYDLFFEKPEPLIPRHKRYGISGRILHTGEVLEELNLSEVDEIALKECREGLVVVIVLLHSYANPAHEIAVKKRFQARCPKAVVVASHEVDPLPMEFERTSTTVVNGILKPLVTAYLESLEKKLRAKGFKGVLLVMQSSGGVASQEEVVRIPASVIESGPAAGAVATAFFSRLTGIDRAVGFDMGGTTAKASSIVSGRPLFTDYYEVGGKVHAGRIVAGSGYPLRLPHIDLAEVSAGGGTIAWVDRGGSLRVGPLSAGSEPGPACYGRGGKHATVTDANLVLNRLPEELARGQIKLKRELAREAINRIARELGVDAIDASIGIVQLANTIMARAVRLVTVERGFDPREFCLVAFGGAGPLHAVELARELEVNEVIVPPLPGVFSALGLLVSDYLHYFTKPIVRLASELDTEELERGFLELEATAVKTLKREGVDENRILLRRVVEARYRGQSFTLKFTYRNSISALVEDFHREHEARYGYSSPGESVDVVSIGVEAVGVNPKPKIKKKTGSVKALRQVEREVYDLASGWVKAEVYDYDSLPPGFEIEGPAIIEHPDSTTYIPVGSKALVGQYGEVRVSVRG